MSLIGSFHRRELNQPAISFSSTYGKQIFTESLSENNLENYFLLAENYITQSHPAYCGLSSLTMALNALLLDPERIWQGVWRWYDESMLGCCKPHDLIKLNGLSLKHVNCLAKCNGANTIVKYSNNITIEEFRSDVIRVSKSTNEVMILSYYRPTLNQSGSGHFSPIGGYNSNKDLVLIMDVARFKYPPHWIPLSLLFDSMNTIDTDSNRSRGYILLSKGNGINNKCKEICIRCDNDDVDSNKIDTDIDMTTRIDNLIKQASENSI